MYKVFLGALATSIALSMGATSTLAAHSTANASQSLAPVYANAACAYVDADGDGVCDNAVSGVCPQDGTGYGHGHGCGRGRNW